MIERGCADFDLAALRGLTVDRKNFIQQIGLAFFESFLILFAEVFAFVGQPTCNVVLCKPLFVHPGELRQYLKIAPVACGECDECLRSPGWTRPFKQFDKAREARHQTFMIELKRSCENLHLAFARQVVSVFVSERKTRLVELAACVFLDLHPQRRDYVERGVEIWR